MDRKGRSCKHLGPCSRVNETTIKCLQCGTLLTLQKRT